ncbi:MAG TPA: hypothetical protein VFS52_10970 [Steroidobacteraceae bacterium]|jgi:hypothetical protein|nr:hypothetical protein [Steroidobacteraceae bacterium]
MRRLLAALLLVAAFASASAARAADDVGEGDAAAVLDACIARLDAQIDVGYERIARRCPDLAPALERSGWAAWLPQGWKESRNDLSAGSLRELKALVTRELATQPTTATPRVEHLKDILADLGATGQQRSGAWTRFKKWLRSLFERAGQQDRGGWLSMVARMGLSDAVMEVITYVALGLVVALAGFIVFNELRLAGLLGRRRGAGESEGRDGPGGRPRVTWSDIERAPLLDRPRLMLELIAAKLTALGRLPPAGALTARELVRAADLSEPAYRERLSELALTAERAVYAPGGVSPAMAETAVTRAHELLAALDTGGPGPKPRSQPEPLDAERTRAARQSSSSGETRS